MPSETDYVRAGDLVSRLFDGPMRKGLSDAARAAKAWYVSNGDRERMHTTGVWLRKARRPGLDPILVVGLDSSLLALELGTNKELYLMRLSWAGVRISDISFTVSSRQKVPAKVARQKATEAARPLPELTDAERDRVRRSTQGLPDGLRESVSRAMSASLRRSKSK